MANFEEAIAFVLPHEGGFTANPTDPGNWTGGKVGDGQLKGTNFGISAKTYPNEDIKGMTVARAKAIYQRDFWKDIYSRINSQAIANKFFDLSVNMGSGTATKLLQTACIDCGEMIAVDGTFGNLTLNAVNGADSVLLLNALKKRAVEHYQRLVAVNPDLSRFIVGWCRRAME